MELAADPSVISLGAIVRFEAPGSRSQDEGPRMIPAIVLNVWPDGSLQLYALHFEGSFLVNQIARSAVTPLLSSGMLYEMLESFNRRLRLCESQLIGRALDAAAEPERPRGLKPGTLAHAFAAEIPPGDAEIPPGDEDEDEDEDDEGEDTRRLKFSLAE